MKKIIKIIVFVLLVALVITSIVEIFVFSNKTKKNQMTIHDEHICDIAESTDMIIELFVDDVKAELAKLKLKEEIVNCETNYINNGINNFSDYSKEIIVFDENLIKAMFIEYDGNILYCDNDTITNIQFKNFCMDSFDLGLANGEYYLAFLTTSAKNFHYGILIEPLEFYSAISNDKIIGTHWVALYSSKFDFIIQNNKLEPNFSIFDKENIINRNDAYSLIYDSEQLNEITYNDYFYVLPNNYEANYRLISLPIGVNDNKIFSIGVTIDYNEIGETAIQATIRTLILSLVILVAIVACVIMLITANAKENKMSAELEYLNERKEKLEYLNRKIEEIEHRQRLESIGVFSSTMAHDFNNLLTPIMGYSSMLINKVDPSDEELLDNLNEIYQASLKAKKIISSFNSFAKTNNLECSYYSVDDILLDLKNMFVPTNKKVECILDLNAKEKCVYVNEMRLVQACINIAINAYQAIGDKEGRIIIKTEIIDDDVVITFSDNGPGMPQDVLVKLFTPFYTTKENGSGLGLLISKHVVEQSGGTISVESIVGEGSTFTIKLPKKVES